MIHGVCVGWTSATSSALGVAVMTTIHGVWVGGGDVGSGVAPHAASRPARTHRAESTDKDLVMLIRRRCLEILDGLVQFALRLLAEFLPRRDGL